MKGKVLLIGAEDEENLAIRYLGAVLIQNRHKVRISACSKKADIKAVISDFREFSPDLVAISIAFQSSANLYFNLVKIIKNLKDVHITLGGHFPTFEYRKILETQAIDSVIRFEGEYPITQLMDCILNKRDQMNVPNLVYRENNRIIENPCICKFPDLDKLPFPLRRKKPHARLGEKFATITASRGCFHSSCLYCCIGAFHSKKQGAKYALRSPENIAEEIAELYNRHRVRLFQFHDDNFMLPNKEETVDRFQELKSALSKKIDLKKISFLIKARPDSINKDVADSLAELGVIGVFLGVENASNTGLKSLIRGNSSDDIDNALKILKNYKMAVTFNLLIFHPNATLDEINENIQFIKKNMGYPLDFGRAEIVAGSPLERQVTNEGLVRGKWPNWDYWIKDKNVERIFQINKVTFRKNGSNYAKLVHSLIALSYHAYLINRTYPGSCSEKILDQYKNLIIESNIFILDKILGMYKLAAEIKSETELNDLYNSIKLGCSKFLDKADSLSNKMNRLQILESSFSKFNINKSAQEIRPISKLFRLL